MHERRTARGADDVPVRGGVKRVRFATKHDFCRRFDLCRDRPLLRGCNSIDRARLDPKALGQRPERFALHRRRWRPDRERGNWDRNRIASRGGIGLCEVGFRDVASRTPLRESTPAASDEGWRDPSTIGDAAKYMVALPEDRRRAHWQRAAQLVLDGADAPEISRQVEFALFYDRKLDLKAEFAGIMP
jgi:hypothetical protein